MNIELDKLIAPAFYDVHHAIKEDRYTHYRLGGGRGSTKSSFIGIEIVLGIMRDPAANALVLRKIEAECARSVYEQIKWAIDVLGVGTYWRSYTSPLKIVYMPTGQKIVFRGADDPKKVKGTKFSKGYCKFIWYEELPEFTPEDVRTINQTLLRGGPRFTVLYSYNPPPSVQSWVNVEAMRERDDGLIHHSTYLDVPREWLGEAFFIEAEHLKRVNPELYDHDYLGKVTGTGGEVFRNVKAETITDEQINQFDRIKRGLDFGYASDPLAFVQLHYDKTRRRIYIYDEIYAVEMSNNSAVERIKAAVKVDNPEIIADSAEPRTINEFRGLGLHRMRGARKGPDSVNHGVKYLRDLEAIIIDPKRCPNAFKEFTQYELEKDKNGNFKASYPDKNNHLIDGVRYALNDEILDARIYFK
jgi:phage terminase large subunit